MFVTIAITLFCIGLLYVLLKLYHAENKPPKLGRYPIVGSVFHMKEPLGYQLITEFQNKDVVDVKYGIETVYFLNSGAAVREAFVDQGEKFAGRSRALFSKYLLGDVGGIIMTDGQLWKEYRRFTLKTLRDFGFGRKGAEEIITIEAQNLAKTIDSQIGKPIETARLLSVCVSNVICQFVFGSRLASEDPNFDKILETFKKITQNEEGRFNNVMFLSVGKVVSIMPFLVNLLMKMKRTKEAVTNFHSIIDYCKLQINQHEKDLDLNAEPKDYIEAHFQHVDQNKDSEYFNNTRLALAITDLFLAGTDTTSHTLRWAILYMIKNPQIVEKLYQEVQNQIGIERDPRVSDRVKMPYMQATIEEINRLASLAPEGVLHRVTETAVVSGYTLHKNALVKPNILGIHRDPKIFPEPELMKPERHLKADGTFQPHEDIIPFSLGKRACLGESLAKMELFIFFTTLIQKYTFELGPNELSLDELLSDPTTFGGGVRAPKKHNVVFRRRAV